MNQPFLHRLVCLPKAPLQWWSTPEGEASGRGVEGIYCGDDRVIAGLTLAVTSHEAEPIGQVVEGSRGRFTTVLRTASEGVDPLLTLTRHRQTRGQEVSERIEVASAASQAQRVEFSVSLRLDATAIESVKVGLDSVASAEPPSASDGGWVWHWRDASTLARLVSDSASILAGSDEVTLSWDVAVEPGEIVAVEWRLELSDADAKFVAADVEFALPDVSDTSLRRLLEASAADLQGLALAERDDPSRYFLAAGAPWFFTLFGRDSLIAAMMAAEAAPQLALATLRTLAARQGVKTDVNSAEQPGKILHEVRRVALDLHDNATVLPPEYYGTIDATPLWLLLADRLVELGRGNDVSALMDHVIAALGWLRDHADADSDGFLEYFDESGHGLANQGWKDSGDSIRFADGAIAEGPIVLVEVQGYAAAAAQAGARILARFGRSDEERDSSREWESYAEAMAGRIREHFWLEDEEGPYLAIALDKDKQPVTGVSSNMGHLLGLGVLSPEEERSVVARLVSPSMASGFGIRTMSTTNGAYWPLRYHVGSVWTHDTAWIIGGMARSGFLAEAGAIAQQLLRAAEAFDFRLPELFGGWSADEVTRPVPYPASCRPQAWAAASAFVIAEVLTRKHG